MQVDARRHHGNRHGRSEIARRAVLEAADDLLAERGFAGVTIEGIATRAGVAKQTIYRWWSSKTEILLDAFLEDAAQDLTLPERGDLEDDLRSRLYELALYLTHTDPGAVFRALIGEAQHDPALAATLRRRFLDPQHQSYRDLLEAAVARGELPATINLDTLVDELVGPVFYRILITDSVVDRRFIEEHVARLLAGAPARTLSRG